MLLPKILYRVKSENGATSISWEIRSSSALEDARHGLKHCIPFTIILYKLIGEDNLKQKFDKLLKGQINDYY